MALIACSECQREVSTKAHACPHCGNPLQEPAVSLPEITDSSFPVVGAQGSLRGRCYACGATASRSCTYCGKLCCGQHITWFHPIKGAGAVCLSCRSFGWMMSAVGLIVVAIIMFFMFFVQR